MLHMSTTMKGQDNLPLAMHFIPSSLQFTRSGAMPAKPTEGFLTIQHAHLCAASAGSIVILRLWVIYCSMYQCDEI